MKFEIEVTGGAATKSQERRGHPNGNFVGTAEWQAPGRVALDMADEKQRTWFERFFAEETSSMSGPVDCAEMTYERRHDSEQAFQRAAMELAAHAYKVRAMGDSRRHEGR